jgi:hypothetical protein
MTGLRRRVRHFQAAHMMCRSSFAAVPLLAMCGKMGLDVQSAHNVQVCLHLVLLNEWKGVRAQVQLARLAAHCRQVPAAQPAVCHKAKSKMVMGGIFCGL